MKGGSYVHFSEEVLIRKMAETVELMSQMLELQINQADQERKRGMFSAAKVAQQYALHAETLTGRMHGFAIMRKILEASSR